MAVSCLTSFGFRLAIEFLACRLSSPLKLQLFFWLQGAEDGFREKIQTADVCFVESVFVGTERLNQANGSMPANEGNRNHRPRTQVQACLAIDPLVRFYAVAANHYAVPEARSRKSRVRVESCSRIWNNGSCICPANNLIA